MYDVRTSLVAKMLKLFAALLSCLSVLHNYFEGPIKLFLELYLAKFLDISATILSMCVY